MTSERDGAQGRLAELASMAAELQRLVTALEGSPCDPDRLDRAAATLAEHLEHLQELDRCAGPDAGPSKEELERARAAVRLWNAVAASAVAGQLTRASAERLRNTAARRALQELRDPSDSGQSCDLRA
jgi:hypothetical protein